MSGPLLLSVDFEDWHQLVRRRVGMHDWDQPSPALVRQSDALLALFDELGLRATFFVLGIAARRHPQLIERIAAAGHEVACHGDSHLPVHGQTPGEFAADLRRARDTIEQLTGRAPAGYRAPAFSITRESDWAYTVLADEGFVYDSSQHDSPKLRDRSTPAHQQPYPMALAGGAQLWEFPIAVWRIGRARVPLGGASYWRILPDQLVVHGLARVPAQAGLYLHPYELDPSPLRAPLPAGATPRQRGQAALRAMQRNAARRHAPKMLREIASRFQLIPYGEAYAQLSGSAAARTQPLPRKGSPVRRPV